MAIQREYFPIGDVAQILNCKIIDLIHLGANGKLKISVLCAGKSLSIEEIIDYDDNEQPIFDFVEHNFYYSGLLTVSQNQLKVYEVTGKADSSIDMFEALAKDSKKQQWVRISPENAIYIEKLSDLYIKADDLKEYQRESNSSEIEKPLSTRTQNNNLRLIMQLANGIEGFNPQKPYEAAQLIIDETGTDIGKQTISDYITKAYEIESQKRD